MHPSQDDRFKKIFDLTRRVIMVERSDGQLVKTFAKTEREVRHEMDMGIYTPIPIHVLDLSGKKLKPTYQEYDIWLRTFETAQWGKPIRRYLICG